MQRTHEIGQCLNQGGACTICRGAFHDDHTCANGHKAGSHYRWRIGQGWHSTIIEIVECTADGTRCNLCGGLFGDGEDHCSLGRHEVGHWYPIDQMKQAAI